VVNRVISQSACLFSWSLFTLSLITIVNYFLDEDEADALLKKHNTLCDDIEAFKRRVADLEACRNECSTQKIDLQPDRLEMKVIKDYTSQLAREISVKEGDLVQLLSNPGGEWVKEGVTFVFSKYSRKNFITFEI
jgi:hypothetical protein